jgi:hypothetical protein
VGDGDGDRPTALTARRQVSASASTWDRWHELQLGWLSYLAEQGLRQDAEQLQSDLQRSGQGVCPACGGEAYRDERDDEPLCMEECSADAIIESLPTSHISFSY